MPRLSRPTLNPKASSAWVTALSEERDWAYAQSPHPRAAAATPKLSRLRHIRINRTPSRSDFRTLTIIGVRGSLKWRRDEIVRPNSASLQRFGQGRLRFD